MYRINTVPLLGAINWVLFLISFFMNIYIRIWIRGKGLLFLKLSGRKEARSSKQYIIVHRHLTSGTHAHHTTTQLFVYTTLVSPYHKILQTNHSEQWDEIQHEGTPIIHKCWKQPTVILQPQHLHLHLLDILFQNKRMSPLDRIR